jgi:hypothetical protein
MRHWLLYTLLLTAMGLRAQNVRLYSQKDKVMTAPKDTLPKLKVDFTDKILLFNAGIKKDSSGTSGANNLVISGYVDAYYAYYTDSTSVGGYEKFPTSAPRGNAFGLNIAQISTKYSGEKVRGVVTLQYGDIPQSAWSPQFNMIQEANMGLALGKKIWLDAGFFRTHLGCESIQPRENINIGMAVTTYFEPYYLSGAKLSYTPISKLMLQASVFNGFNTFVPINNKKTYGFSATYEWSEKLTTYYNVLVSNEFSDDVSADKLRFYHDLFAVYKSDKFDAAGEFNFGSQRNSALTNTTRTAYIYSGTLILKHKFKQNLAWYARYEFFEDSDEMLTGPVYNQNHSIVGVNEMGYTLGFEVKPIESAYVRIEGRYMQLTDNEKIFRYNNRYSNVRYECIVSMGFWF